ncbi:MAG TPA: ASCH domain-containing protein [Candidatus Thermoplasmatota archaeon]|nr:ASCH domain-containing protein [Candidatus Thermoplasmatota archaeon]
MKLPIKKKYFDLIKSGDKNVEYRDGHITFICEETKEQLRKEVNRVFLTRRSSISPELNDDSCFTEDILIGFDLVDAPNKPLKRDVEGY